MTTTQSDNARTTDLLRFEPDAESKLYLGLEERQVDAAEQVFTQAWLERATLLKIRTICKHIDFGHFGPVEKIAPKQWRFHDGHRAICRFNNGRYEKSRVLTVRRNQAQEIKQRLGFQYDSNQHLAVYRYDAEEARELATQRVDNEIAEGMVNWQGLDPASQEYQDLRTDRIDYYCNQLLNEIMLIKKADSTSSQQRRAELLLPTVLWHIDQKLPKAEAEYFLTQYHQYRKVNQRNLDNPVIEFIATQSILEQLVIRRRREMQILAGDITDDSLEKVLTMALKRWKDLSQMIIKYQGTANGDGQAKSREPLRASQILGQFQDDQFE